MECNILLLWTGLGILGWVVMFAIEWFRYEEIQVRHALLVALISIICGPYFILVAMGYVAYLAFRATSMLDIWSKKIQRKKKCN
jgi:uncharacterized membrane protein YGL010W